MCTATGIAIAAAKAGKAILRVPPGGKAVVPAPIPAETECLIAAVSSIGRLLMFEMDELPELAKGKGNKIIQIPPARLKKREEYVKLMALIPEGAAIKIHAGRQSVRFTPGNISAFVG